MVKKKRKTSVMLLFPTHDQVSTYSIDSHHQNKQNLTMLDMELQSSIKIKDYVLKYLLKVN